jgi:hypothetical protein
LQPYLTVVWRPPVRSSNIGCQGSGYLSMLRCSNIIPAEVEKAQAP